MTDEFETPLTDNALEMHHMQIELAFYRDKNQLEHRLNLGVNIAWLPFNASKKFLWDKYEYRIKPQTIGKLCPVADLKLGQGKLMRFDPSFKNEKPFPSHAQQYRDYHGKQAWLINPWTGKERHPADIGSDPTGILICN